MDRVFHYTIILKEIELQQYLSGNECSLVPWHLLQCSSEQFSHALEYVLYHTIMVTEIDL